MAISVSHRLSVVVLQAEPVLSLGLAAGLRQQPGFDVAVATSGTDTPAGDVYVADYAAALQLMRGRAGAPQARVVVVTTHEREQEIRRAFEAGVRGYVLLGCTMEEVAEAVRCAGRGSRYLSQQVAQRMADSLTRAALTSRELQVLQLLTHGLCNKTIARELEIAVGTVKAHVKAIMAKLEARSRTQIVAIAAHRGLVADLPAPSLQAA